MGAGKAVAAAGLHDRGADRSGARAGVHDRGPGRGAASATGDLKVQAAGRAGRRRCHVAGDPEMTESETRCGFAALVGAPNAAKSTLITQLVGDMVSIVTHTAQTTTPRIRGIVMEGAARVILVDLNTDEGGAGDEWGRKVRAGR